MIKFPNLRSASTWLLVPIPLLLIFLCLLFVRMAGGFPDDPDYSYLLNGLEVLTFYPPSYISHPGTTLIMLVAVVNFITWLFVLPFHRMGLVEDVLSNSQFYLSVNNAVLAFAIAAAAFWLAYRVRRVSGSAVAALAGQISLLVSFPAMIALNRVAPEPLLLVSALMLVGLLVPFAFGKDEYPEQTSMMVGVVLGFSIATKITAMPLLFLLFLLPGWKLRKRAGLYAVAAMIFFTLPVAHHYPQMLHWFAGMAIHSGSYSDGAVGLPPAEVMLSNAIYLLRHAPELFIAIAIYGALAALGPRVLRPLMIISALVLAAQILVVLKQPEVRYLIPVVAVFALANAAIFATILARGGLWRGAACVLLLLAICNNILSTAEWSYNNQAADRENRRIMERVSASGCGVIPYYEAPSLIYDLDFGNQYAGSRFRAALQRLYPKNFTYDWARHSFMHFGTPISAADLKGRLAPAHCIYLMGSPQERFKGGFPFGIPISSLTLAMRTKFGNGQSVAVYLYRP